MIKTSSNALGLQKKLRIKPLRKPLTPYILGGVALTVLVPYILRILKREDVVTFVRDNVDNIRTRIDGYIHTGDANMDSLNQQFIVEMKGPIWGLSYFPAGERIFFSK